MRIPLIAAILGATLLLAFACDDDEVTSAFCRENPRECDGAAGTLCDSDRDCNDGFCCDDRENNNCGPGMCTFRCDGDRDCPPLMLCEHDLCFYACDSDRDCAPRMSCEHGNTICEY